MQQIAGPISGLGLAPRARLARPVAEQPWESVLVVVAALICATNFVEIFLTLGAIPGETYPPQVRLTFLLIYAVFGLLLLREQGGVWMLLLTAPVLTLVLAVPLISTLWSVDPGETLERSVAMLGTSLFGAYLGWRFMLGRLIFLLAIAMAITVSLSMAVIVLIPSIGIEQGGPLAGTWTGVHLHKNGLGGAAAMACLLTGYAITDSRGCWRLAFCLAFLLSIVLLIGSRSTSSLVVVLVVGALALWALCLQNMPMQILVLSLILVPGVAVAGIEIIRSGLDDTLAYFGKDASLSSRVPLWSLSWSQIEQRLWLGYGYEAFWQPDAPRVRLIAARLYFTPFYSHNGLLETLLNGGLLLVALMLLLLTTVLIKSAIVFCRWRDLAISSFPFVYSAYFLMMNFAESFVLARNSLIWALFVSMTVFVSKWARIS